MATSDSLIAANERNDFGDFVTENLVVWLVVALAAVAVLTAGIVVRRNKRRAKEVKSGPGGI